MKVVRAFLGGAWGVSGELEGGGYSVGNTYEHVFTYQIPATWKLEHIWLAGLIAINEADNKNVLNCCYGEMKPPPPILEVTSEYPGQGIVKSGETFTRKIDFKNISDIEHTFDLTLEISDVTPEDWSFDLNISEITIASGSAGSFEVSVTLGETLGFSGAQINIISKTDHEARKSFASISAVSKDIEYLEIISKDEMDNSIYDFLSKYDSYIQIPASEFSKYAEVLTNIKTVVWNLGNSGTMSSSDVNAATTLVNNGINLFLLGANSIKSLNDAGILEDWGLEYVGYSDEGYKDGHTEFWSYHHGVEKTRLPVN
jgi:hypothetical protein